MDNWILENSERNNKRYKVSRYGSNKHINFGDPNYDNFTIHKNNNRKINYLSRHKSRENWNDPNTAGFWSTNLLWNKPTIEDSIKDIEKRFKINIINII